MAGPSDLTAYLDTARTAIAAGDIRTARIQIALAETVLAELPATSAAGTSIDYQRSIDALKAALAHASSATSGGYQTLGCEFG